MTFQKRIKSIIMNKHLKIQYRLEASAIIKCETSGAHLKIFIGGHVRLGPTTQYIHRVFSVFQVFFFFFYPVLLFITIIFIVEFRAFSGYSKTFLSGRIFLCHQVYFSTH